MGVFFGSSPVSQDIARKVKIERLVAISKFKLFEYYKYAELWKEAEAALTITFYYINIIIINKLLRDYFQIFKS